jgi:hypothetical protein
MLVTAGQQLRATLLTLRVVSEWCGCGAWTARAEPTICEAHHRPCTVIVGGITSCDGCCRAAVVPRCAIPPRADEPRTVGSIAHCRRCARSCRGSMCWGRDSARSAVFSLFPTEVDRPTQCARQSRRRSFDCGLRGCRDSSGSDVLVSACPLRRPESAGEPGEVGAAVPAGERQDAGRTFRPSMSGRPASRTGRNVMALRCRHRHYDGQVSPTNSGQTPGRRSTQPSPSKPFGKFKSRGCPAHGSASACCPPGAPDPRAGAGRAAVERPQQAATAGPAVGHLVEPAADRPPVADGFPDDESMRISHEAIYQALFIHGRGALQRELVACLRTGRALRVPRARTKVRPVVTSPPR